MPEALIWGASGGIGGALVRELKSNGWTVFGAARDESRIPAEADAACAFEAGSSTSAGEAAYSMAQHASGSGLDLVIYAAGGMAAMPLESTDWSAWTRVFDANLTGAQRAAAASIAHMREGGALMFLGAYVDKLILPKFGAYTAAKAGLDAMAAILAKEHRKLKITVVRPPAVNTPFWVNVPFNLPKNALSPEVVAAAIRAHYDAGGSGTLDL